MINKEDINKLGPTQVRDLIVKEQIVQEQKDKNHKKTVSKLKSIALGFDEKHIEQLREYGLYVEELVKPDYDRMLVDRDYYKEYIQLIRKVTEEYKEVVASVLA
ncbi:hypothetical protein UT300012_23770 [Paraclostridium bifermentans]